jgi:hypothetical protein
MQSGYTFGPINNEYVMSFQMNNDSDRGFWWGDDNHTNAQGAMALSTDGLLVLATGMRIGYGQSDTTEPVAGLQVSGNIDGDYVRGDRLYAARNGATGYFFKDSTTQTRVAYTGGNFYIRSEVGNCYLYAANTYLGGSAGDNIRVRGNTIFGNSWSITGAGVITAASLTCTGNITAYSDERLKNNIKTLDGSKVLEMRGVSFTKDGKAGSGVIAQELEQSAPECVEYDGTYKSVAYGNLVGYLIENAKQQQNEIDELKDLVKKLMEKQTWR